MADVNMPYDGGGSSYSNAGYGRSAYGYTQGYQAKPHQDIASPHTSDPAQTHTQSGTAPSGRVGLAGLSQMVGGMVSVALVAGVTLWGYQLIMRDVSGVPVVRAMEGPMRIAPELPGGAQAAHQGLAVNEVAGRGAASGPVDQLRLAPPPLDLTAEDQPSESLRWTQSDTATTQLASLEASEATAAQPSSPTAPVEANVAPTLQDSAIQALADQIAADVAPLSALAPADTSEAFPQVQTAVAQVPATQAGSGVRSLRPQARPSSLVSASLSPVSASTGAVQSVVDLDPAALPAGTRLVQLGAYDSMDVAQAEWTRISGRFDSFFEEKRRVIQQAESGGRTFYRLRAEGFADIGDARRFCAALVAERTDCIPVVVR